MSRTSAHHRNAFRRTTAASLAVLYFLMNVALSHAAETNLWDQRRRDVEKARKADTVQLAALTMPLPAMPSAILAVPAPDLSPRGSRLDARLAALPFREGTLRDVWASPSPVGPPVILVQDVHLNADAQQSIARIIDEIQTAAQADKASAVVGVEGAFGPFDFRRFRAFPDAALTREVARHYLDAAVIAAPSFVGLTAAAPPDMIGVDDPRLHRDNVAAYRAALPRRAGIDRDLAAAVLKVNRLKEKMNPRMKAYDALASAYGAGQLSLAAYLRRLSGLAAALPVDGEPAGEDPVVTRFLTACALEATIDFAAVEREKADALRVLADRLRPADLAALTAAGIAYKEGRLSYARFLSELRQAFTANHVPLDRMPALNAYLDYVAQAEAIQSGPLFAATRGLERRVLNGVVADAAERALMDRSRDLTLLGKLNAFGLTPDEWQEYKQHFLTDRPAADAPMTGEISALRARLSDSERFYRDADLRSARLVDNLLAAAADRHARYAVMIVGGFHTPGIAQALRGRGISYAVVQARLKKIEGLSGAEYLSVFSREKTPLEKLLSGERLFVAPTAPMVGTGHKAARAATLRVLVPLAVGNASVPAATGVVRRDLARDVVRISSARDGADLVVARAGGDIAGYDDVAAEVVPPLGLIRFLLKRPSVREIFFPSLSFLLTAALSGLPAGIAIAVVVNAAAFAALHPNRKDGRFDSTAFTVRLLGVAGLLSFAWAGVSVAGLAVTGASLSVALPVSPLPLLVLFGALILIAALLHEAWNAVVPARFSLSTQTPSDDADAPVRAYARRLGAFPAMAALLPGGDQEAASPLERAAIQMFLRQAFERPTAPSAAFRLSERIALAIQDFLIAEMQAEGRAAYGQRGRAGLDAVRDGIDRRLRILRRLYQRSNTLNADAIIAETLSDDNAAEGLLERNGTLQIQVPGRPTVDLPLLVTPSRIQSTRNARLADEATARFESAEGRSDLAGMAAALVSMPEDAAHHSLASRYALALDQRLSSLRYPSEIAAVAAALPESMRAPVFARAAAMADEMAGQAGSSAELDVVLPFLPEGDSRRDAAVAVRRGLVAAEAVLRAGTASTVPLQYLADLRRNLPVDHPVRVAAEAHLTALQEGRRPAPAQVEPVQAPVTEPAQDEVAPAGPVQREQIRVLPGQAEEKAAFEQEFRRARAAMPVAEFTNEEFNALRLYFLALHAVRVGGQVPHARFTARLIAAIRTYEKALVRANAVNGVPEAIREAGRRRDVLFQTYERPAHANLDDIAAEMLDDDAVILVKGKDGVELADGTRISIPVVASRSEMDEADFARAERGTDLNGMNAVLGRGGLGARRDRFAMRLGAVLDRVLPSMENVDRLDDLQNSAPEDLRDRIADRRVAVAIDRLLTATANDAAETAALLIPADHLRRAEADVLLSGIRAANQVLGHTRRASVPADLPVRLAALPAGHPARVAADAHLQELTFDAAREEFHRAVEEQDIAGLRAALARLPEDEQAAAGAELHRVAAEIVAGAPSADAITDDVLTALIALDRPAAEQRRAALRAAESLPTTASATPDERLRAARARFQRLQREALATDGGRRVSAAAALLHFARILVNAGLADYLRIQVTAIPRLEGRIGRELTALLDAANEARTFPAFEAALAELELAFRGLRREGIADEYHVPTTLDGLSHLHSQIWGRRLSIYTHLIEAAVPVLEHRAPRLLEQLQSIALDDEGRLDTAFLSRVIVNTRALRQRAEGMGERLSAAAETLREIENALTALQSAAAEEATERAPLPAVTRIPANPATLPPAAASTGNAASRAPPAPPTVPPTAPPVTSPAPSSNPAPAVITLAPEKIWQMRGLRLAVFAAVAVAAVLVAVYAPNVTHTVLRFTDFSHIGTNVISATTVTAIGLTGFWLVGARVTYLTVRFLAILFEIVTRVGLVVVRRLAGLNGSVSFTDKDGTVRKDGVVVDFFSNSNEIKAALSGRFGAIGRDLQVERNGRWVDLSHAQLLALYYRLDAQDARLAKVQKRLADEAKQAEESRRPIALRIAFFPIHLPVHLATFLRDFFFRTDLDRLAYLREGRFINHFDTPEQGRRLIEAAVTAVRAERGMSWSRGVSAWYFRNNVALAGLLGYLARRVRITVFGMIGGWLLAGVGYVFPWLATLTLDPWLRAKLPINPARDGAFYRYGATALRHLSFSTRSLMSVFFTAFGLNLDSQIRRIHGFLMAAFTSPLGAGVRTDFDAVESSLRALADRDAVQGDDVETVFEIIARTEALLRTQRSLPRFSTRRLSLGRFSDDEATVIRAAIQAVRAKHFPATAVAEAEFDARFEHRVGQLGALFAGAPGLFSGETRRALMKDLKGGKFWGNQVRSMFGMWTLGAEIAVVVELVGDLGALTGRGIGHATGADAERRQQLAARGELAGRHGANLLEGEHDSAMSLMGDLQKMTIGRFGLLPPPVMAPAAAARPETHPVAPPVREDLADLPEDPARAAVPRRDVPRDARDFRWIPADLWASASKWALLQRAMRESGIAANAADGRPVEIPTLPVDRNGIPVRLVDAGGNALGDADVNPRGIFFLLADGGRVAMSDTAFDPVTRSFSPPAGKTFDYLRLNVNNDLRYVDAAGHPLRDTAGRVFTAGGFRVQDPAAINGLTVRWRDAAGVVTPGFRRDRPVTPVNPVSGDEIILESSVPANERAVATGEANVVILQRRLELTRGRLNDAVNVAYEIDADYRILKPFATFDLLTDLHFFRYPAGGGAPVEFDPRLEGDVIPDVIRRANGNEVVFTVRGERASVEARRNANIARSNAVGAWATRWQGDARASAIEAHQELLNNHMPSGVFMLIKLPNGNIETVATVAAAGALMSRARVPGPIVASLCGDMQFQGLTSGSATVGGVTYITNDSPEFFETLLEWYQQRTPVESVASLTTADYAHRVRLTEQQVRDLDTAANAVIRGNGGVRVGGPFNHLGQNVFLVQADVDMVRGVRADRRTVTLVMTAADKALFDRDMMVRLPDGSIAVRGVLAYRRNEAGNIVGHYTDPITLHRELQRNDLLYKLSDGRTLSLHQLPPNLQQQMIYVTEIIDPVNKERIVTGSTWALLNYRLSQMVRIESQTKGGQGAPPVIVGHGTVTVDRNGHITDLRSGLMLPARYNDNYELALMTYLADLRQRIENAPNAAVRRQLLDQYRKAMQSRMYILNYGTIGAAGGRLRTEIGIVKGTGAMRLQQSFRELEGVLGALEEEELRRQGGGYRWMVGGHEYEDMRALHEQLNVMREDLVKDQRRLNELREKARTKPRDMTVAENAEVRALPLQVARRQEFIREVEREINTLQATRDRLIQRARNADRGSESFRGNAAAYQASLADQRAYVLGLQRQLAAARVEWTALQAEIARERMTDALSKLRFRARGLERRLRILDARIDYALKEDSYVKDGIKYILVSPYAAADARARRLEQRAADEKDGLQILDAILNGRTVIVRREANGAEVRNRLGTEADRNVARAATVADLRARAGRLPLGDERTRMFARATEIEGGAPFDFINPDGSRTHWLEIRNGGVAIHYIRRADGTTDMRFEPIAAGQAVLTARVEALQAQLRSGRLNRVNEILVRGELERIQRNNVVAFDEAGLRHQWELLYSVPEAQRDLDLRRTKLEAARQLMAARGTHVWDVAPDGATRIIVDEAEVRDLRTKLEANRQRLRLAVDRRRVSLDGLRATGADTRAAQADLIRLTAELQQADRGIFVDNNHRYVVNYSLEETQARHLRVLRAVQAEVPTGGFAYNLLDSNDTPVANVVFNGQMFLMTEGRVMDVNADGVAQIELRVFSSRTPPTATAKGTLFSVSRINVDADNRILSQISGTIDGRGLFTPRTITFNEYAVGISRPVAGRTYAYAADVPLDGYAGRRDLFLDWSRSLTTPDEVARTGQVHIEVHSGQGAVWQEIRDLQGRVLVKIEGRATVNGRGETVFLALRRLVHHFDDADYALHNIPSYTEMFDLGSGERLGWSIIRTPYDDFAKGREVRYERWTEKTKEMTWEVRNADGLLVRKFTLEPVTVGGRLRYVPYNVTVFVYSFGENSHGIVGFADRAYTYETNARGLINGTIDPTSAGDPATWPYFEHTELAQVVGEGATRRVVYRVSVRNGDNRDFEQFQEVKNGEGLLLERHVGHRSTLRAFVPEEITFNDYNPRGFGRYDVTHQSKTFYASFSADYNQPTFDLTGLQLDVRSEATAFGPDGAVIARFVFAETPSGRRWTEVGSGRILTGEEFAGVPMRGGLSRLIFNGPAGNVLFAFTLKEQSDIRDIDATGHLDYAREVYRYQEKDGRVTRIVHSTYQDRIYQGHWRQSYNFERRASSRVEFDHRKTVASGRMSDASAHPSLANAGEGESLAEETNRRRHGVMANPFLPDMPARFWIEFEVVRRNRAGDVVYRGTRWVDVYGRTAIDVADKVGENGERRSFVAVHVSDQDELAYETRTLASGANNFEARFAGAVGDGTVDASQTDFVYLQLERAGVPGRATPRAVITFRDSSGREVRCGEGAENAFWLPVSGNTQRTAGENGDAVSGVQLVADSAYTQKRFVLAVPVQELRARGLDVARMRASVGVAIANGAQPDLIRVSAVYRAGRLPEQRVAGERPFVERNSRAGTHWEAAPSGQVFFHDATGDSREGSGVLIKGTDGDRLLGVVREYRYRSERGGIPVMQRRLILYDEAGVFPIASVRLVLDGNRLVPDMNDVLPYSVREDGHSVIVYGSDPTTNPPYPFEIPYRMDALDPSRPETARIGEFTQLPGQREGLETTAWNRLHNSPFQVLMRWARGERLGISAPNVHVDPARVRDAVAAIDPSVLQSVRRHLDTAHTDLPEDERPVEAAKVKDWSLRHLLSLPGVALIFLALMPAWLLLWSWHHARAWRGWRAFLTATRALRRREGVRPLWDEAMMLRALQRFNEKVFETKVRSTDASGRPVLMTSNGDIEGAFVNNLFLIYLLNFAANERAAGGADAARLRDMDLFARSVSRFLTTEIGRGSDAAAVKRPAPGSVDVQIWGKTEIFLSVYRDRLKSALLADRNDDTNAAGVERFDRAVDTMRTQTLVAGTGADADFSKAALDTFIARERFEPVLASYITIGRYLAKLFPVVIGMLVLRAVEFTVLGQGPVLAVLLVSAAVTLVVNAWTESRAITAGRILPRVGILRGLPPFVAFAASFYLIFAAAPISFGAVALLSFTGVVMLMEALGILLPKNAFYGNNRSVIGVSFWYHMRPPFSTGRPRAVLLSSLIFIGFVTAGIMIGTAVLPWFLDKFAAGSVARTVVAFLLFVSGLPSLHHGINLMVRTVFSAFFPTLGAGDRALDGTPPTPAGRKLGVMHVGGNPMTSPAVTSGKAADAAESFASTFGDFLRTSAQGRAAMNLLFDRAVRDARMNVPADETETDAQKIELVRVWMTKLNEAEIAADPGEKSGTTLWSLRQMYDPAMPEGLKVGQGLSDQEKAMVEHAFHIRRSMVELMAGGKTDPATGRVGMGGNSIDSAINFVDWAEGLGDAGLAETMVFYIVHNQYDKHGDAAGNPDTVATHNRSEIGQRVKLAALLNHVSRRPGANGVTAYVMYNHTVFGMKSSAMNADRMRPEELPLLEGIIITDRNTSYLDVPSFVRDIKRMRGNRNIVIMVARRNTTYTVDSMGKTSFAIEGGHGESMKSLADKIGTGWGNMMRVLYWDVMKEFGNPDAPFVSFAGDDGRQSMYRLFGIIGFAPNAVGISEDYWAVIQQYHNMVGLGRAPELALSEGLGHKVRESKDYSEWQNAPPRWSSGLDATMQDMLNQQANEFGPDSIFEKEARQTNGDHYLLGPLVLFQLFMVPLAVILDLSPFVGLSIVFWMPGVVLNQISTLNSLLANVRHMGFRSGLSRWLRDRIPDSLLFAPRTVRDALAQITGYKGPSFEFKISGAGGTDDPMKAILALPGYDANKPVRSFLRHIPSIVRIVFRDLIRLKDPHTFLNTFTIGVALLGVNLVAMQFLDATNAVMMILSLWFSVGVAFGPMLKSRKVGSEVGGGVGDLLAKLLGFSLGFVAMTSVSTIAVTLLAAKGTPVVALIALVAVLAVYRLVGRAQKIGRDDRIGPLERLTSEGRRGFWSFVLLFGWFVFVPAHPLIRFDLVPGIPLVFTPAGFGLFVLVAAAVIALIILEGIRKGADDRDRVAKRYQDLSLRHARSRGADHSLDNQINALFTQVVTFTQQESYRYAHQALDQISVLIDGTRVRRDIDGLEAHVNGLPGGRRRAPREVVAALDAARQAQAEGRYRAAAHAAGLATEMLMPGAMGVWRRIGLRNIGWIGRIETVLSVGVALGLLIALLPAGDPASLLTVLRGVLGFAAGVGPLSGLTAVSAAAAAVAGLIGLGHLLFGVQTARGVRRDRRAAILATLTASLPLLALPAIAVGLTLGAPAGLLAVVGATLAMAETHAALNRRASAARPADESDLIRDAALLKTGLSSPSAAARAEALSRVIVLENLGLETFGRAAGRDRADRLAEAFGFAALPADDVSSRVSDRFYLLNRVAAGRPDAVSSVRDALSGDAARAEGAVRDVFVPKPAATAADLRSDIVRYRGLTGQASVTVLLTGENERFSVDAARLAGSRGGAVLRGSEIGGAADLEKALADGGASLRRLRMIVHKDASLPDNVLNALVELGHRSESPVAVDLFVLAALTAEALAIRAGAADVEGLLRFRRLVGTQA